MALFSCSFVSQRGLAEEEFIRILRLCPAGDGGPHHINRADFSYLTKLSENFLHVTTAFLNRHHANANMMTVKTTSPPNAHIISIGVYA